MRRARWPRIGLTARVRAATIVVALALGAVFAVLLHTVDVSRTRDNEAMHSTDVLEAARGIEGSVIDLETGLRGYIISGRLRFLDPYRRARRTQPARLRTLKRLVADNPSQSALADELSGQLESYVDDYTVPLIAAVTAGRRVSVQQLSQGRTRVDRIRATLDRFTAVEDGRKVSRRAAANSATRQARLLTIFGLALLVLVVISSGTYASRYVAEPVRRLARSARRVASGNLDERVKPSGAAELSDLGIAFNQMAASLHDRTQELERLSASSAAQFSAIFEQTPIGLTLFDRELRCVRCNPALAELAVVSAEDQRGRSVSELFGMFEPDITAEFGRVLQTGRQVAAPRITSGDNTCTVRLFPVRRADGELIGVAAVVTDVTERERRLERERVEARRSRQLERLTASISQALTPNEISEAVAVEAATALDADGGAILLLDEERETLTISGGLGWPLEEVPWFTNRPLADRSPTTDAVRTRRPVVVGRVQDVNRGYPAIAGLRARHHIGSALSLPLLSGPRCLGALLVTFSAERDFSRDELRFAQDVAERCAGGIARALLYEREHATAAALQRSLMPVALPTFEGVVFGARFRAAGTGAVVGGDFYDVIRLGEDRFVAWIGDVQGKGPSAAAVAALARYTLRAEIRHEVRPARLLAALNEAVLAQDELGERLLTAVCVSGEVRDGKLVLEASVAGHPAPLLLRSGRPCAEWGPSGTLIGFDEAEFRSSRVELDPGEVLILYTDGVTEAHAPQRFIAPADLCRLVDGLDEANLTDVLDLLLEQASPGENDRPRDDIALLGLHFAPRSRRETEQLIEAKQI